jgi:galactonate dehydratase
VKITAAEVTPFADHDGATSLLVLRTDSALTGLGEIFVGDRATPLEPLTGAFTALLVGRDPFDTEALDTDLRDGFGAASIEFALAAAAGTAMADICGQHLDVPVHQLLGGRVRDRVRACATGWADGASGIEEVVAAAARTVEQGFTALRVVPLGGSARRTSTRLADASATVRTLRERLPDEIDLVVDAGGALTAEEGLALAGLLAPLEPLWLESPVPATRLSDVRRVAEGVTLPLAGGRGTSPDVIRSLLTGGLIDHVIIEVGRVGGLLEARRIAALAEIYHVGIVPVGVGRISVAAAMHLAASTPNVSMIEVRPGTATVENGMVAVDLGPGLGVDAGRATRMEVA